MAQKLGKTWHIVNKHGKAWYTVKKHGKTWFTLNIVYCKKLCWERDVFLTYTKLSGSTVKLGDGRNVKAAGEGIVKLKVHRADGREVTLKLHCVLHVPEMSVNLLSVKDVTDRGFRLMFTENCCQIQTELGKLVAE